MTDSDDEFIAWRAEREPRPPGSARLAEVKARHLARVAATEAAQLRAAGFVAARWVRDHWADSPEMAEAMACLGRHALGGELFEAAVRGEGDAGR